MSLGKIFNKKTIAYLTVFAFLLYLLIGFVLIPVIAKSLIHSKGSELLGRDLSLKKLSLNPLTLCLKLEGLLIPESDGSSRFVSWETLTVDASWASIFRLAPVLDELSIDSLNLVVKRNSLAEFNFQDILDGFSSEEVPASEVEEKDDSAFSLPLLYVDVVAVRNSSVHYEDDTVEHFEGSVTPLNFEVLNLTTKVNGESRVKLSMLIQEKGLLEWEGSLHLAALQGQGTLSLKDLPVYHFKPFWNQYLEVDTKNFLLSFNVDYAFDIFSDTNLFVWENGNLSLNAIEFKHVEDTVLSVKALDFKGISGNLQEQFIALDTISLEDAYVNLIREFDGRLNFEEFARNPNSSAAKEEETDAPSSPWKWQVGGVDVHSINFAFIDESMKESYALNVFLDLQMQALNSDFTEDLIVDVSLALGGNQGKIHGHTELNLLNLDTDLALQIEELRLEAFASYVKHYTGLELYSGVLNTLTTVELSDDFQQIELKDSIQLNDFHLLDSRLENDLLSVGSLDIADLSLSLPQNKLEVQSIEIDRFSSAFEIDEAGLAILPTVAADESRTESLVIKEVEPELQVESSASPVEADSSFEFLIHSFRLQNSHFIFLDRSVLPIAKLAVSSIDLSAKNINSNPDEVMDLNFSSNLNASSTLNFSGKLTPFSSFPVISSDLELNEFQLVPFQGYTAKYIGRYLDSGSFSMDSVVRTDGKNLDSKNHFVLDSVELGKDSSNEALFNLPVGLALMILKNSDGDIIRDIPAVGQTDDPDFRVRTVVWKEVRNIFTKVISSPFSALAKAAGAVVSSDEELSNIYFEAGSADLLDKEINKLETMANIFGEKPQLHVQLQFLDSSINDIVALEESEFSQLINRYNNDNADRSELLARAYLDLCSGAKPSKKLTQELIEDSSSAAGTSIQETVALDEESDKGLFSGITFRWETKDQSQPKVSKAKTTQKTRLTTNQNSTTVSAEEMEEALRGLIEVSAVELSNLREERFAKLIEALHSYNLELNIGERLTLLEHHGVPSEDAIAHFIIQFD